MNTDLEWMHEKVTTIKNHEFLYKFMCFFTFRARRKMTYSELFLIFYGLHKRKIGDRKAKELSLNTIIKIYTENNGKKPEGI